MEFVNRKRFMLFTGSANPELAHDVAEELGVRPRQGGVGALRQYRGVRPGRWSPYAALIASCSRATLRRSTSTSWSS